MKRAQTWWRKRAGMPCDIAVDRLQEQGLARIRGPDFAFAYGALFVPAERGLRIEFAPAVAAWASRVSSVGGEL